MTNILTRDARAGLPAGHDRPVRPGLILAVVLIGQFMAVLDASIVNVAAPSIHASLRASGAGLQLVVAGYTITYAVLLVTGARLGDIIGHRRVFLSGLVLFTLASLGCGLAGTAGELIALRFAQGAGAAMMIPQVLSLIQRTHAGPDPRMAASVPLVAAFAVAERRAARAGGTPLIPGRVLRVPGVPVAIAALFTVMTIFSGFFFTLALHLQDGLGFSPLRAGLAFAPAAVAFALVSLNWRPRRNAWRFFSSAWPRSAPST